MLKASKGRDPTSRSPEALKKVLDKVQVQLFSYSEALLSFIGTGLLGVRIQSKYMLFHYRVPYFLVKPKGIGKT